MLVEFVDGIIAASGTLCKNRNGSRIIVTTRKAARTSTACISVQPTVTSAKRPIPMPKSPRTSSSPSDKPTCPNSSDWVAPNPKHGRSPNNASLSN